MTFPYGRRIAYAAFLMLLSFSYSSEVSAQYFARTCIGEHVARAKKGDGSLGFDLPEAERIILDVARSIGLSGGIKLVACRIGKVEATNIGAGDPRLPEGEYITYNPDWTREVIGSDRIQLIALLGHELGHFLNRHFTANKSLSDEQKETQADQFAGCAVARMKGDWKSLSGLLTRLRREQDQVYPNRLKSLEAAQSGFTACGGNINPNEAPRDNLLASLKINKNSFCPNLKIVNQLADTGFSSLRGSVESENKTWKSKFTFDGFKNCSVNQYKPGIFTYICTGEYHNTYSAADKQVKEFIGKASNCLGDRWLQSQNGNIPTLSYNEDDRSFSFFISEMPDFLSGGKKILYSSFHFQAPPPPKPATPTTQAAAKPEGYCDQLKEIVAAAPSSFANLVGRARSNRFVGKIEPTGWQECRISELGKRPNGTAHRYYTCELPEMQDKASALKLLPQIGSDVRSCLGSDWSFRRRIKSDGTPVFQFTLPADGTEVEVRITDYDELWRTKLDINEAE